MSIKYRKEMGRRLRFIEREAAKARGVFIDMAVFDADTDRRLKQRLSNRFLVKGRPSRGGRVIWDVYALNGTDNPVLIAGGFAWQEVAIAFARDRKMGRHAVSFGGVKGLFKAGQSGLSLPSRSIDLPGGSTVAVKGTKSGVIVG